VSIRGITLEVQKVILSTVGALLQT